MKYSIVIPIFNEAKNIAALHAEVCDVIKTIPGGFEILIVNDGSTDDTAQVLKQLSPARVITLRRNYGQTAALDAGFKHSRGEWIITMDGDGQNPPHEIPKLLRAQEERGVDVVSGWRKERNDPHAKYFISRGANVLRKIFIDDGIHDSGCTLKLYRRECFEDLDLFGEMHRFIPGMLRWQGFTIGEVVVEHRARRYGTSKYNVLRIVKGLVDMISVWFWRKYSARPLHLFGGSGILLTCIGGIILLALGVARLFFGFALSQSIFPLLAVLFILVGIQLFVAGLFTEILIKQYYRGDRTPYRIRSIDEY